MSLQGLTPADLRDLLVGRRAVRQTA